MSDPPTNIRALQADQILELTWPDNRVDRLLYHLLRSECPCAACQNEWTGERMIDPASIRPDLKVESLQPVGTYAVQLGWNDGHSSGLFTWETLRRLGRSIPRFQLRLKTSVADSHPNSLLTVAVPTYNGAAYLAETLRSILSQEGPAFELVISDDRSEDQTLELVREVAGDRARIEVNSERLGLAGNWNRCAVLARTPLVSIFHQDDVMLPGHLSAHQATFVAYDQVGLIASASVVIDERGDAVPEAIVDRGGLGPLDRVYEPGRLAEAMAGGNPLRCSAVTMRFAAFANVGGFDPSYQYVLDWDFWLRLSRQWRVAWLSRPTVQVRWHPASETHRFKTGTADLDETRRFQQRLFAVDLKDQPDADWLRRVADERLGRAYLNRAHDALRAGRPELARDALRLGFECSPGLLKAIIGDPRLAFQMAALTVAPRLATRLFARRK